METILLQKLPSASSSESSTSVGCTSDGDTWAVLLSKIRKICWNEGASNPHKDSYRAISARKDHTGQVDLSHDPGLRSAMQTP